ncbi:MAG: hypothetical protein P8099_20385 [Gemmatimonadota bacterium]
MNGIAALDPSGRLGRSEGVADRVVRLSSDMALFVAGAWLPMGGGHLTR